MFLHPGVVCNTIFTKLKETGNANITYKIIDCVHILTPNSLKTLRQVLIIIPPQDTG